MTHWTERREGKPTKSEFITEPFSVHLFFLSAPSFIRHLLLSISTTSSSATATTRSSRPPLDVVVVVILPPFDFIFRYGHFLLDDSSRTHLTGSSTIFPHPPPIRAAQSPARAQEKRRRGQQKRRAKKIRKSKRREMCVCCFSIHIYTRGLYYSPE